ncbi:TIGR03086 family metal-binding protein [Sphaerisporangium aureirubrum]|uniref:TIGR03086 family metal-binding protein n=1 Tax=Sphaerisporangium aureirubrum TaxID=1544736 RepID=A0ABW1NNG8_9ACTN
MMTVGIREAYRRALDDCGVQVQRVAPGQWWAPTPCAGWDVRTLVNHLVGESLMVPELMSGRSAAEIGDLFEGDLLGDDPVKAYDVAAAAAVRATEPPDALTRTVRLSFGDVSGEEYFTELFADALIHTWDISTAIGPEVRLDPELVRLCAEWFARTEEAYRQTGVIGERPPLPADADPQTRLLAAWGRCG